jgi:hypothetical protein
MSLRLPMAILGLALTATLAAAQPSPGSTGSRPASTPERASAPTDWPATGKPGQKREFRDSSGRKIIEYYDHQGIRRVIRDSGQNG